MKSKLWLVYALATTIFWGVWGALIGLPTENGFPETLVYCVWAITMIPPAFIVLNLAKWKLEYDRKSIIYGLIIGLFGAGGQLILFHAVKIGPPHLIFPIISLSPVITIVLSLLLLKERTGKLGAIGIVLALVSLPLLNYSAGVGNTTQNIVWFLLALLVLIAWGVQAYFMKLANETMSGESIFFYMMLSGLVLIPIAIFMTDFSAEINWGIDGPWLAAGIQILNSLGALSLVFAFRYGKAIVVSPLTNAGAPLITSVLAMILLGVIPNSTVISGIGLAVIAALLLAIDSEE
ncbi:MAG: DMT family transporter [Cyclobacteriaceae bacterium]|nr:DMT family transporter [Cyclobacteriaceae bacterium]